MAEEGASWRRRRARTVAEESLATEESFLATVQSFLATEERGKSRRIARLRIERRKGLKEKERG